MTRADAAPDRPCARTGGASRPRSLPARRELRRSVGDARLRAGSRRPARRRPRRRPARRHPGTRQLAASRPPRLHRVGRRASARRRSHAEPPAGVSDGALARRHRARGAAQPDGSRACARRRHRGTDRRRGPAGTILGGRAPLAARLCSTSPGAKTPKRSRSSNANSRRNRAASSTRVNAAPTHGTRWARCGSGGTTTAMPPPRSNGRSSAWRSTRWLASALNTVHGTHAAAHARASSMDTALADAAAALLSAGPKRRRTQGRTASCRPDHRFRA